MQLISSGIPKADAYGGVLIDWSGKILLREPKNHFGGYAWTYAKGRPDPGETPEQAALREVLEETGQQSRILSAIPMSFAGTTTSTSFFLMYPDGEPGEFTWETVATRWVEEDEARALISTSPSATGRKRDLDILDAALEVWRAGQEDDPASQDFDTIPRLFEMLSVLHQRGYQRLRFLSYERPVAYRLGILPRFRFSIHNGGWIPNDSGLFPMVHSSSSGTRAFRWLDAENDTPEQLADKYILRFPEEAAAGFGPDPDYNDWFQQLLGHTRRGGLPAMAAEEFSFGPYNAPATPIIFYGNEQRIDLSLPLPPPGELADDREAFSWTSSTGLSAGLELAMQPNYLGSPSVVSELLESIFRAHARLLMGEGSYQQIMEAQKQVVQALATDKGEYTRMPGWHTKDQLGQYLIRYMELDADYNSDESFVFTASEAMTALSIAIQKMLSGWRNDPVAEWHPHALQQLNELHSFAVTVLLGTNTVSYPGRLLGSFEWQPVTREETEVAD